MIPGLDSANEARLLAALCGDVSTLTLQDFAERDFTIWSGDSDEARRIGVVASGPEELMLVVTDPDRPIGRLTVSVAGRDGLLFIDNARIDAEAGGSIAGEIRLLGDDAVVFINGFGAGRVGLRTLLLRSHRQFLFWGAMATAVEVSIELEGDGEGVVIGDDALISGEVWIRNHDMHALHDLRTGDLISRPPTTMVLERHVWLAQGVLLLGCTRIGAGTVVGARSLVKGDLPRRVLAAGKPARVLREEVSWGRSSAGMTATERASLGLPALPAGVG